MGLYALGSISLRCVRKQRRRRHGCENRYYRYGQYFHLNISLFETSCAAATGRLGQQPRMAKRQCVDQFVVLNGRKVHVINIKRKLSR